MKAMLVVVMGFVLTLSGVAVRAQQNKADDDTVGLYFNVQGDVANYVAYMPASTLRKSPVLDFANPELPKSLKEIVDVAWAELEKNQSKKPDWTCTKVVLTQPSAYNSSNQHADVSGKWFYVVWLQGPFRDPGTLMVPVTLDGKPGVVKKVEAARPAGK